MSELFEDLAYAVDNESRALAAYAMVECTIWLENDTLAADMRALLAKVASGSIDDDVAAEQVLTALQQHGLISADEAAELARRYEILPDFLP